MLFEQRTDPAQGRTGEVGGPPPVGQLDRAQQRDRNRSDHRVERGFCCRSPLGHQNATMIFPKTWRLSSRARPRSKSPSATSVSITGVNPSAILARLSRTLRSEAPNEPKMRYCWV